MIKYIVPKRPVILFVGINPHYGSYKNGVPFSNNKNFWYLLNKSGLIHEDMRMLRNTKSLKKFYMNKFGRVYKYGFVNLIDRPTRSTAELKRGEESNKIVKIRNLIRRRTPKLVCFIGKVTYEKFSGAESVSTGLLKEKVEGCRTFVVSFPIRGPNSVRINELRRIKRIIHYNNRTSKS